MRNIYENKIILVTGGVGSIGSEIVHQLLAHNPKQIRIFDNRETESFTMQHAYEAHENLRFLIGDVRDRKRLGVAMQGVDIVFHAAALKHVPLCEYNPLEPVQTNVHGTQNLIEAAYACNVEKVINISTDKVTNAINVMGATKLLAERLVASAQYYKINNKTIFSSVRFGNVIGSRGSVITLFKDQIAKGGPVTLTAPKMTRYIMSIPQAVTLVLTAAEMMYGGEVFIFKMPVMKITDLAEILIEKYAPEFGYKPSDIILKNIGLRPGEKMYEDLMTKEEAVNAQETDTLFMVHTEINIPHRIKSDRSYSGFQPAQTEAYSSENTPLMSKAELRTMLEKEHLI